MRRQSARLRNQSRLGSTSNVKTGPTTEDASVTLLDLPTEMLAWIADFVDSKDLLSLRLTHSVVSAAVDDVFANAYFRHRLQTFNTASLEILAEICCRPNWAAKMKSIEFRTVALDPKNNDNGNGSLARRRTRAATRAETAHSRLMKEIEDNGQQQDCLVESFAIIEELPHAVDVTLSAGYGPKLLEDCFGFSRLVQKVGSGITARQLLTSDCNAAFLALMKAWDLAEFYPFDCNFFMCQLELGSFDKLITQAPLCPMSWANLCSLDLGIAHTTGLWHAPHTSALEKFFLEATELASLSLHLDEGAGEFFWPENNSMKWLAVATSHMKLLSIHLTDIMVQTADLIALATTHKGTLRNFSLCLALLPADECWSAVFSSLKTFDLQRFSAASLAKEDDDGVLRFVNEHDDDDFSICGEKDEVKQELEKLASNVKYVEMD